MSLFRKSLQITGAAAIATLLTAGSASADTFYFNNNVTDNLANLPVNQLYVEVTCANPLACTQVNFKFFNNVGTASSIADIYFYDGTLLGISSVTDSGAGVDFLADPTPGNLPGVPPALATAAFSADSTPPSAPNGVNSNTEWVQITFDLINGKTFTDTIAALNNGTLIIGLHVQAIGGGGSDSYTECVAGGCPTPGTQFFPTPDGGVTVSLLGMAMAGLGLFARRRK